MKTPNHTLKTLKISGIMLAASMGTLAIAGGAQAATITFDFNTASFSDTGAITGSFNYDTISNTYSALNIMAGAGTTVTTPFNYLSSNSTISNQTSTTFNVLNTSGPVTRQLEFLFSASLATVTTVGQTITIDPSTPPFFTDPSREVVLTGQGVQTRGITGGIITATNIVTPPPVTSTPEPGTILALGAVAGLGLTKLKKNTHN